MHWGKDLYVGDSIKNRKKAVIKSVEAEKDGSLILICLSLNPEDQLDLFPARVVFSYEWLKEELKIVGIAADREEAFETVRRMSEDAVTKTGDGNLRGLFTNGENLEETD